MRCIAREIWRGRERVRKRTLTLPRQACATRRTAGVGRFCQAHRCIRSAVPGRSAGARSLGTLCPACRGSVASSGLAWLGLASAAWAARRSFWSRRSVRRRPGQRPGRQLWWGSKGGGAGASHKRRWGFAQVVFRSARKMRKLCDEAAKSMLGWQSGGSSGSGDGVGSQEGPRAG